jgi:hypothetical protein
MSIGIMDADMSAYTLVPFNLEVMKLSAYYKKKGEIVVLSPSFTPERNTQFFYRKDYNDGEFPMHLTTSKNVEYGGLAFSNNVYQPLPMAIEKMRPDPTIYERMEQAIKSTTSQHRYRIYQNMMTAEHCRISLDGKTIWEDYPRQFKFLQTSRNIMFHDYDLAAIDGGFEEVQRIMNRARTDGWATKVGMKFPVRIDDGQSLLNWSSLNSNGVFYSVRHDGVIEDEPFLEWVGRCKEKAIYSQMEYHITPSRYDPNEFIEHLLPKIFRQVIISRSYRVFFTLVYDEGFFPDRRWEDVIRLFNYYHNSYANEPISRYYNMIADDTLFNFAANSQKVPEKYYGDVFNKDKIREIFVFVRERHPELFNDFYECSAKKLGGKL